MTEQRGKRGRHRRRVPAVSGTMRATLGRRARRRTPVMRPRVSRGETPAHMPAAVDQQHQQQRYSQGHGGQHQGRQSIPPQVGRAGLGRPALKKAGCFDPAKPRQLKITYQIAFRPVKENTGASRGRGLGRIMPPQAIIRRQVLPVGPTSATPGAGWGPGPGLRSLPGAGGRAPADRAGRRPGRSAPGGAGDVRE